MRESPYKERRCAMRRISLAPLLHAWRVEEMMRRPVQLFAATTLGMLLVGSLPAEASHQAKVEVLSRRARPAMGKAFPSRKRVSVVWAVTLLALLAALAALIPASEAPNAEHHSYSAGSTHDQSGAAAPVSEPAAPQMSEQEALDAYKKLPLSFVPNEGQTEKAVRYYAQGAGYGFFFTKGGAMLSFADGEGGGHALALDFLGADPDATL